MPISRQKIVITALAAAAAVLVLAVVIFAAAPGDGAAKLEGAWVAQVISYPYGPPPYPYQWSYVLAPDASGRSATIHGSVDVAFPQNPLLPYDFYTPLIGEIALTGPDTASFDVYWRATRKVSPVNEIVFIGRSWGEVRFVEPGKAEATHNFEIYLPSADTNGDGVPEGSPIIEFTVTSVDTRIPPPAR